MKGGMKMTEDKQEQVTEQPELIKVMDETSPYEYVDRDLTEEELTEKKLQLIQAEIHKDKTDIDLAEMEKQLDSKLPSVFLDDDIKSVEEDITNKTKNDKDGKKIPATEGDLEYMKNKLVSLKKSKELDVPMRELRYAIQELRYKKNRYDAPEKQIKKLQKEIRERRETTLSTRVKGEPESSYIG
jgi:hypothetical protein